jgi:hypothetical protein
VIFVGIDDTDIINTPGTNQLARVLLTSSSSILAYLTQTKTDLPPYSYLREILWISIA